MAYNEKWRSNLEVTSDFNASHATRPARGRKPVKRPFNETDWSDFTGEVATQRSIRAVVDVRDVADLYFRAMTAHGRDLLGLNCQNGVTTMHSRGPAVTATG
ncbi:hypothetical protein UNPF46_04785 [Bradyrhizobium sp. UNPF46]|nr:hypothetical protein UNPF46_04785 [Bradyrhizobium sp. UNPF46]